MRGPSVEARACDALSLGDVPSDANVVLVVNDTMRRDRPGAYGGPARTPHLDGLAQQGLLFERAVSQSPWTKPSIATLFTSLTPSQHGLESDREHAGEGGARRADVLPEALETLAERLRVFGLRTAAFVANPWMQQRFGFGQGFEIYDDSFSRWDALGVEVDRAALAWLDGIEASDRFFLYLHYIDSHRPYGRLKREDLELKPAAGDSRQLTTGGLAQFRKLALEDGTLVEAAGVRPSVALLERAYDRSIEDFDAVLGVLLDALRRRPDWPRTAVIVTSDHGEALYQRGYGNHGMALFDDEAAVPLVARMPGVVPQQGRVECVVGLIDLMPSVCSYLGVQCPGSVQGWSLFERRSRDERRVVMTEGVMMRPEHRAVRGERYKLLYEPEGRRDGFADRSPYSLYDLERDPQERDDLLAGGVPSGETGRAFTALRSALHREGAKAGTPVRSTRPVDLATAERLRELGYTE